MSIASLFLQDTARAQGSDLQLTEGERAWLAEEPVVRVAPAPNFPPVEFFDEQGVYRGIAADYAELIQSMLGTTFEIVRKQNWNEVLEATQAGEVDVWMEAADTPERREYMRFTRPYLELPAVIIVRRDVPGALSLGDLAGLTVAAIEGYASADYVAEHNSGFDLVEVPSVQNGLERVSFGSADALVANVATASHYIERLGLTNLRVAGDSGFSWSLAIGCRRDTGELHEILQKALDAIPDDEKRSIYRRWVSLEETQQGFSTAEIILGAALFALIILLLVGVLRRRREGAAERISGRQLAGSWPMLVAAAAAVTAVCAAQAWSQSRLRELARRDLNNSLQTVLHATSEGLYQWFDERAAEIGFWSDQTRVRDICLRLAGAFEAEAQGLPRDGEELERALNSLIQSGSYEGYSLYDAKGVLIASDDPDADSLDPECPSCAAFLGRLSSRSARGAISLPEARSTSDGASHVQASLLLGRAIRGDAGQVKCILALRADPGAGFSEVLKRGRLGESGESYALNREGQLISSSRFDDQLQRAGLVAEGERAILNVSIRDPGGDLLAGFQPALSREEQPLTVMAREVLAGRSASDLDGYNDYRGAPVVGVWVWDNTTGLGIATEIDYAEAYASYDASTRQGLMGTAFTIALILVITYVSLRSRSRLAAANFKLEDAYRTIETHKKRMEDELNVGREIQMSMIPLAFPEHDEFALHATIKPAREVGGDLYDFFFIDEERFCFCVGDVSGKGVPAALFMAVTKTLVKSRATGELSTAKILTHVNDELSLDNPNSMFVTVFLAILNTRTGEVVYTNAGHNPPYVRRDDGSLTALQDRHGPVLGAVEGLEYSESRVQMTGGGSVVLFTDGVTEAMNASGDQFSERRLVDVLSQESRGVKETVDAVVAAVDWFEGDTEQSDDVTVLVLEYRGRAARAADTAETIRISNALPGISEVLDRLDVFAAKHAVPAAAVRRAKTILDDLLNNIVSYGYETPGQDEVHIRLERGADHLRISTLDHGIPFNPLEQKAPDTEAPLEERAIGGLGIHLIQTLADAISYERLDDANVLTIDIRLGEEEA